MYYIHTGITYNMFANAGPTPTPVASIELASREMFYRVTVWDDSVSFVAKPVKLRTRAGKDYFVLRVTIPKEVSARLQAGSEDYLLLRAKIAQWYHMVDWKAMPEAWEKLPSELKVMVAQSGLPVPEAPALLPSLASPAGSHVVGPQQVTYLPSPPTATP